jgi:hypothetical protein
MHQLLCQGDSMQPSSFPQGNLLEVLNTAKSSCIGLAYQVLGWAGVLHNPPAEVSRNVVDYACFMVRYEVGACNECVLEAASVASQSALIRRCCQDRRCARGIRPMYIIGVLSRFKMLDIGCNWL